MEREATIVVFSHLRWDFVYQRPQHLLSRMAAFRRVLFIEEPVFAAGAEPHWEVSNPAPNVRVCRPITPVAQPGFSDAQYEVVAPMVAGLLADELTEPPIVWVYTPMAEPLAREVTAAAVVYDCMDELSLFAGAPKALVDQENRLLERADVVFTGGPSLYRAKQGRHDNLWCFPSSVEVEHFRQACPGVPEPLPEPPDQAGLPHPRLGFYGVIDERMDLDVLRALAAAHPEWQIVLLGPVVKIDPATLPQAPNLHYLGQKAYADLPAYLAGWDVCLLPFARNEATRFISPTKTLEYMAAERMIVSTPIADVAEPYNDIVFLGDTPAAFVAACERALAVSGAERADLVAHMRQVLRGTSWNRTARAMEGLIQEAAEKRRLTPVKLPLNRAEVELGGDAGAPRAPRPRAS